MKEICVVHLVRAQNGIESFSRFLESYREFSSGVEHDFLVVFKGFNHSEDTAKYKTPLAPLAHLSMDVSDEGFDITAYFSVVNRYSEQYRYFCFVNSHSEILDKDWLKKLYTHISIQGVGMVGATGSWESHRESTMPLWKLPIAVVLEHYRQRPTAWGLKWLISELPAVWRQSHYLMGFDPFPNFHIRTNAFMISSDLIKS